MIIDFPVPLLGFCAWSGTGKTTLLTRLIPILKQRGVRLALIKHSHHSFDIDRPGKDSFELRKAGAEQILIASRHRVAVIRECPHAQAEPSFEDTLGCIDARELDLVLVEGFKTAPIPKVELHRPALGKSLIYPDDPNVVALASDAPVELLRPLPVLDLNNPGAIANFIACRLPPGTKLSATG